MSIFLAIGSKYKTFLLMCIFHSTQLKTVQQPKRYRLSMFLRVITWKVDIETNSNRMTPKDHLAAGTTRKVVVLKDLSNKPYPSPVNLLITSIKSQKCFQKICQLHKMYLQKHILLYRETLDIENFQFLILSAQKVDIETKYLRIHVSISRYMYLDIETSKMSEIMIKLTLERKLTIRFLYN